MMNEHCLPQWQENDIIITGFIYSCFKHPRPASIIHLEFDEAWSRISYVVLWDSSYLKACIVHYKDIQSSSTPSGWLLNVLLFDIGWNYVSIRHHYSIIYTDCTQAEEHLQKGVVVEYIDFLWPAWPIWGQCSTQLTEVDGLIIMWYKLIGTNLTRASYVWYNSWR